MALKGYGQVAIESPSSLPQRGRVKGKTLLEKRSLYLIEKLACVESSI
jgi:hypothetical protein